MRNREYWRGRFAELEEFLLGHGTELADYAELQYRKTSALIEQDISHWYQRFADNNEISLVEAKKWLNAKELEKFRWTVDDYIRFGEKNALDGQWMKELENASSRVHISRLESLQLQLQQHTEVLFQNQLDGLDMALRTIATEGYYRTGFELSKGFGVSVPLSGLNTRTMDILMHRPWNADGLNFSDRVWSNRSKLVGKLETHLTQSLIRGEAPDKTIAMLAKEMGVSKSAAGRLVMTESAYIASAGQRHAYGELGVERYEIVATLDGVTSDICQDLDGLMFRMTDYEVGVTAPPFHPWCRSVTAPYFDDNGGERFARDAEGKGYYVDAKTKYPEWKQAQERGILKMGEIGAAIPIVPDVIANIPLVQTDLLSEEGNQKLQEAHQDLLTMAQRYPVGTEVGATFDLKLNQLDMFVGEDGGGSVNIANPHIPHVAIHNHPDGLTFSIEDYLNFGRREDMKILTAIGNDGSVFIIEKTNIFDIQAYDIMVSELYAQAVLSRDKGNLKEYLRLFEVFYKGAGQFGGKTY